MAAGTSKVKPDSQASAHRLDIQGLRAIAVAVVVIYHSGLYLPGGFVGVDVFLVISGYVITSMLLRELHTFGRVHFRRFYLRRYKRLTPALALTVLITVIGSTLLLSPFGTQQQAGYTGLGAMLLAANVVIARTTGDYFAAPAEANPLLHTWSLSVEEQFYLFFPLVLWLAWRGTRSHRSAFVAVLTASVGSFALAMWGAADIPLDVSPKIGLVIDFLSGFYSPLPRVWEFGVGALLAFVTPQLMRQARRTSIFLSWAGLGLILASLFLINGNTPFPGPMTVLPVAGAALMIAGGTRRDSHRLTGILSAKLPVIAGDWSYSIYLWHWPFIVFAKQLWPTVVWAPGLAAIASVGAAAASYRWLEEPLRQREVVGARSITELVLAVLLPPIIASTTLVYAADQGFWNPRVQAAQLEVQRLHAGAEAGCHTSIANRAASLGDCTWNSHLDGAPIYLVGDSHAEHWSEATIEAGLLHGRPTSIHTHANCPAIDIDLARTSSSDAVNDLCRLYRERTLGELLLSTPGVVIISNADSYWESATVAVLHEGVATHDSESKLSLLKRALVATISSLREAGHDVVIVQARPMFVDEHSWSPEACSVLDLASGDGCGVVMPIAAAEARQGAARRTVEEAVASAGATLIDSWDFLCEEGACRTSSAEHFRYRDSSHITVWQSEQAADVFSPALEPRS